MFGKLSSPANWSWPALLSIAAVFSAVALYFVYTMHYGKTQYVPNKEFVSADTDVTSAYLYYFYTEWCPHCKATTEPWNELKQYVSANGGLVNGVKINFVSIDCDKDSSTADEHGITGYPTIKLEFGDQSVTFDAKPTRDTLIEFLKTTLPEQGNA